MMGDVVENKLEFGCESLHFAKLLSSGEYEKPELIEGLASMTLTSKLTKKQIFADNKVYFEISKNTGYEIELEIYMYKDTIREKYFGFVKDQNGVICEPDVIVPVQLALLFKVRGDKKDRVSCLYNVTFEKPDISHKTLEEDIEVEVLKIKGTATPKEFGTKNIIQASTIDDAKKTAWFTTVYKPTFTG